MEASVIVPSYSDNQKILLFQFEPMTRRAIVVMEVEGNKQKSVNIDIADVITGSTATQRTTVKTFFKLIGVAALNKLNEVSGVTIDTTDMSGDIFDDV